jgi:hypothetical protein
MAAFLDFQQNLISIAGILSSFYLLSALKAAKVRSRAAA